MFSPVCRILPFIIVLACFPACTTVPLAENRAAVELQGTGLAQAEALLKQAERFPKDENAAAVFRLRAGELAWIELSGRTGKVQDVAKLPANQQQAIHVLAEAAEDIAPLFTGKDKAVARTFAYAGRSYRVEPARDLTPKVFAFDLLESVKPASEVPRKLMTHWHTEAGAGAPLAPKWYQPAELQRFVPKRGYIEPLTAVLGYGSSPRKGAPRVVSLTAYDPTAVSRVRLGSAEYPLAADFTAPTVERTLDINEFWLAMGGVFKPEESDATLAMLEPYDPKRIPLVFVHGLNSHPRMWRNVMNDIMADPELRGRYQFWIYKYPTGWPIAYSAMRFRDELAALDKVIGHQHDMVLVGHSMGGLLSRLQVISPGRNLWDATLGKSADELYVKLPADHLVKRALLFQSDKEIGRVVFICVPHRGSSMADLSFAGWFSKLIRIPGRLLAVAADVPEVAKGNRPLTGISGLSPSNPLYRGLEKTPIEVPYHSIIGDRGKGNSPYSSDGVVRYSSSHLEGAQSELIVPGPHGSYQLPETIAELERILKLHLQSTGKTHSSQSPTPTSTKHP
jgi:pimeloyl-ACP methyl ester carboxylesterase